MTLRGPIASVMAIAICVTMISSVLVLPHDGADGPNAATSSGLTEVPGERSVSYRWYDFFNVPFGEWWESRNPISDTPYEILTDSFPYVFRYHSNGTHFDTFSNCRLNITGRNMPEINMNERPLFLPFLSGEDGPRGGNATIDWYMQYLTDDDLWDLGIIHNITDGWIVMLNGTIRLDRDGAMAVTGMTNEDFDDFETWHEANWDQFIFNYTSWYLDEGRERLDIFNMYEYDLMPYTLVPLLELVGDELVISFRTIGWGAEALMTKWLRDAFMPTEWWFEDFTMHAEIGPESADIDIDTAIESAVRASESNDDGGPCWVWQGMLQDHLSSTIVHPVSDFDTYSELECVCRSPGSYWNDFMVGYSHTPGCFNLSEGETMSFAWPEEDIVFFEHIGPDATNNVTGPGVIRHSEPLPSDIPEGVEATPLERELTFEGPIDFWTWTEGQEEHEFLADEWDRLGVLPYGMPYVEFSYWGPGTPPVAYIEAEPDPDATVACQYVLDASKSCDSEDGLEELEFRWDLDGDGTMDTDWDSEPTVKHDFEVPGSYDVSVSVKDSDNMTDIMGTEVQIPEIDPPVTAAHLTGTEGEDGWYLSHVTVELSAEDESAIAVTKYRIDGASWQAYADVFEIDSDGVHLLEFYSADVESNSEAVQGLTVKVDTAPPEVTFVDSDEAYPSEEVVISWTCTDSTSKLNGSTISLDGQTPVWIGEDVTHTYHDLEEGAHNVTLVVSDNAGNTETYIHAFTVENESIYGQTWFMLAVVGLVALAAIAVVVLLLIRRRPPSA